MDCEGFAFGLLMRFFLLVKKRTIGERVEGGFGMGRGSCRGRLVGTIDIVACDWGILVDGESHNAIDSIGSTG